MGPGTPRACSVAVAPQLGLPSAPRAPGSTGAPLLASGSTGALPTGPGACPVAGVSPCAPGFPELALEVRCSCAPTPLWLLSLFIAPLHAQSLPVAGMSPRVPEVVHSGGGPLSALGLACRLALGTCRACFRAVSHPCARPLSFPTILNCGGAAQVSSSLAPQASLREGKGV